jgi:hypothetical protein
MRQCRALQTCYASFNAMGSLIGFAFRGTVADIDTTVAGEPFHPTTVLVLEVANTLSRIVLPQALAQANRDALNVGSTSPL